MCARNKFGGPVNDMLPLTELSLADIKAIFPENFVKQIKRLYMCGNNGDPIAANDTLEVFKWLREVNPTIKLGLHTNGSARSKSWWAKLGGILNQQWDYVKFGIDGLEDTNHLYRRGTHWNKIVDNVTAFIAAGGKAHWEYIVFKHNEHQVEEARQLSVDMGFTQFRTKKTGRFFSNTKLEGKDKQEVWSRNGNVEYYIEKPVNPEYHNNSLSNEKALVDKFGDMQNYINQTCVKCKVAEDKSIYISADGSVFPCCWTANQLYVWYLEYKKSEIWTLIDDDIENVSAFRHGIQNIVEGQYFEKISNSWQKPSVADGKLKVCAKTCGSGFDAFGSQFK
jgi:MoaA/NifB/PqqE/SkfB family radical SAM enzyme